MLLGVQDNNLLRALEEKEFSSSVPRKQVSPSRTIYLSRLMRPKEGPMLLSDFGEARIGPGPHGGDIMPLEYRAPETLLYVGWGYPVDIWSVGLTVGSFFLFLLFSNLYYYYIQTCLLIKTLIIFCLIGLGSFRTEDTFHSPG